MSLHLELTKFYFFILSEAFLPIFRYATLQLK